MDNLTTLSNKIRSFSYSYKSAQTLSNKIICKLTNKKDKVASAIFTEIMYWNFPSKNGKIHKYSGDAWQTNYDYLSETINYSRESIRLGLTRLVKMKIIVKELRTIYIKKGCVYNNRLFLHLVPSIQQLILFAQNTGTPSPQNWDSLYNDNNLIKTHNIDLKKSVILKIKNPKKQIVNCSIVSKNNSTKNNKFLINKKNINLWEKKKSLVECLPITNTEVAYLKEITKKNYSSMFINDLAIDLSIKNTTFSCWSRQGFIEYMRKALENERRTVEDVKAGRYEFKHTKTQNRLFTAIENSTEITMAAVIKKRIVNSFTSATALHILKACRFADEVKVNEYTGKKNYGIYYSDGFKITAEEQETLTKIIEEYSSYTDKITDEIAFVEVTFIRNKYQNYTNELLSLKNPNNLKFNTSSNTETDNVMSKTNNQTENCISTRELVAVNQPVHPIWLKVRERLLKRYGTPVDKSWFSKISFTYNEITKTAELGYDLTFRQRKADVDYGYSMYQAIQAELPSITVIKSRASDSQKVENVWWLDVNQSNSNDDNHFKY